MILFPTKFDQLTKVNELTICHESRGHGQLARHCIVGSGSNITYKIIYTTLFFLFRLTLSAEWREAVIAGKMVSNSAGAPVEMHNIRNFSGSYSGFLFLAINSFWIKFLITDISFLILHPDE